MHVRRLCVRDAEPLIRHRSRRAVEDTLIELNGRNGSPRITGRKSHSRNAGEDMELSNEHVRGRAARCGPARTCNAIYT